MFQSIKDDIRYQFQKKGNTLAIIIIINVIIFLILNLAWFTQKVSEIKAYDFFINYVFTMNTNWNIALVRPWTIITSYFSHEDVPHIFWNMVGLYYFGRVIDEMLGHKRVLSIYVLGGIVSSMSILLLYNLLPYFANKHSPALGASGALFAMSVAAATLVPNYLFNIIFIGPVKIKYIVLAYVFISFIGTAGTNAGGNIAHLGGAAFGFIFIKQLQNGNDLGRPLIRFFDWVKGLFQKRSPIKISYRNNKSTTPLNNYTPDQKEIDDILDKISRSGYESLTKEEKQKLFKASQK
jgi:membrane associated rhomboid family serine protease